MTVEKDILLNAEHDWAIVDYDLAFTDSTQITAQRIKQVLLTFQGEWFLDNDLGLPYFDEILGKNRSLSRIEAIYIRELQTIPEIAEILALRVTQNTQTRVLNVNLTVRDIYNNITDMSV